MAKKASETKKNGKKEYKNQNFKMRGNLIKWDTFGKDDNHAWFVIEEETNGTKYTISMFNVTEEHTKILSDSEMIELYFNLSYNKNGNDITLRIVAYEIYSAD